MAGDPYSLSRFELAQEATYDAVAAELREGRKRGHWMWFVFPQLAGLGRSATSRRYAISSLEEARAYLAHPVLGPRLVACAQTLLRLDGRDPEAIFGGVDAQKLRSSMTLFALAGPGEDAFVGVLERYFGGERDPLTERLLAS